MGVFSPQTAAFLSLRRKGNVGLACIELHTDVKRVTTTDQVWKIIVRGKMRENGIKGKRMHVLQRGGRYSGGKESSLVGFSVLCKQKETMTDQERFKRHAWRVKRTLQ